MQEVSTFVSTIVCTCILLNKIKFNIMHDNERHIAEYKFLCLILTAKLKVYVVLTYTSSILQLSSFVKAMSRKCV